MVTPGITRASVCATWSKVLWSSLRTMTRQAPPRPLPGSPVRGSSMVWLMRSGYPTFSLPVTGKSAVHRVGRDRLQVSGARALVEVGEDLAHRRHVLLLIDAS